MPMLFRLNLWTSSLFNGAKQIYEVDFGESETQRVCGISGNPIRLGWNISGNEWQNCFLVPFISPRSPQWFLMYHEMGHNFTWASQTFGQGLGRFEYSEGIASVISIATLQTIFNKSEHLSDWDKLKSFPSATTQHV